MTIRDRELAASIVREKNHRGLKTQADTIEALLREYVTQLDERRRFEGPPSSAAEAYAETEEVAA
ncbi:MAG: hypothetical protein AAF916_04225 [Planctomycetota bacterium]